MTDDTAWVSAAEQVPRVFVQPMLLWFCSYWYPSYIKYKLAPAFLHQANVPLIPVQMYIGIPSFLCQLAKEEAKGVTVFIHIACKKSQTLLKECHLSFKGHVYMSPYGNIAPCYFTIQCTMTTLRSHGSTYDHLLCLHSSALPTYSVLLRPRSGKIEACATHMAQYLPVRVPCFSSFWKEALKHSNVAI